MAKLRRAPGMRERAPDVWEFVVQAGRDPVTGKHRQVSRTFRSNLRNAKKARAELICTARTSAAGCRRAACTRSMPALSSMFTQACRWGWRESNPAQWAEPPSIPNVEPVVPTPEEVRALIDEAERGKRPEMARAILVGATTGHGAPSGARCAITVTSTSSVGCCACRRRS